ncbi:unnamed protein product, partial [Rotaria sordida]
FEHRFDFGGLGLNLVWIYSSFAPNPNDLCECPTEFIFRHGACVNDDECSRGSSICPINSLCRNTPGSYVVYDDECSRGSSICPINSLCRNTPGSYVCDSIRQKGYEVLFVYELHDEVLLMQLAEFDKKKLKSVESELETDTKKDDVILEGGKNIHFIY